MNMVMKQLRVRCLQIVMALILVLPLNAEAAQIGFVKSNIWASKSTVLVGENVTIYAVIVNSETNALEGKVVFINESSGAAVGNPTAFALSGGGSSNVMSAVWKAQLGSHRFKAKIIEAVEVDRTGKRTPVGSAILSELTDTVTVQVDTDGDGVSDVVEVKNGTNPKNPDTDGDTVPDGRDPNPTNKDADNDGDPDGTDPNPTNPNIFTPPDTDRDGKPDSTDSDMDNDGLYNFQETGKATGNKNSTATTVDGSVSKPTDARKYDTDGDAVGDKQDYYPLDPKRWNKEVVAAASLPTVTPSETQEEVVPEAGTDGEVLGEKITQQSSENKSLFSWSNWLMWTLGGFWIVLLVVLVMMHLKKKDNDAHGHSRE